jgi:hypothetical protein
MDEWQHMQAIEAGHTEDDDDLGPCFGEGDDKEAMATVPDEYTDEFRG